MALLAALALGSASVPVVAAPLPGTSCNLFPADNILNTDISTASINSQNATWKSNMAYHAFLHPDLGTVAQQYGMPFNVAPPPSSGLAPNFAYNGESDHPAEGYPIDQNTLIEGGPGADPGDDRHALVVNKNTCKLYEIFNLQNFVNGQTPDAGSGATWNLNSNAMRPNGWTSADAAGLPILPLLLRPDEILAGNVGHAIRFTNHCSFAFVWPGSHDATTGGSGCPPMGARFRLRSSFDISGYSANTQVVLRGFQHYGLILADNTTTGDWFFGGTTDDWWGTGPGDTVVNELKTIPSAEFDAIDESALQVAPNSYQATVVPGGPAGVFAGAGNASATITWNPPSGGPFIHYTVTGSPAGGAVVPGNQNSATISGLSNGTAYTFTVTATNSFGTGPASAPSNSVTPNGGGFFVPINPVRIFDTRDGTGGHPGRLGPGESYDLQVAGLNGVDPAAAGVAINVTVTNATSQSFVSLFPTGSGLPAASSLNFFPGMQIANLVQVAVGNQGEVTVHNDLGNADVIMDLGGWYTSTVVSSGAGLFHPLDVPNRILDTRTSLGGHPAPLGPGGTLNLQVSGTPGVPADGVEAVILNLTAVDGSLPSYLAAYPTGTTPTTSSVNFPAHRNLANRVIVKLGTGGQVSILNSVGSVHVAVDVGGFFNDQSHLVGGGVRFHPTPPVRLLDTRPLYQIGPFTTLMAGGTLTATASGQGLVPAGATAVSGNFTVTDASCGSYLTVYPGGATRPTASDINFGPGDVLPNLVVVGLGTGAFTAYNNLCTADVFVDISGWYG